MCSKAVKLTLKSGVSDVSPLFLGVSVPSSEPYPVKTVEGQIYLELPLSSDVQHGRVRGDGEGGDGGTVSRAA